MEISGPSPFPSLSQATLTDTQRHLSLPGMFPKEIGNAPFKTADHKIAFLKEPMGGETAQIDRREGKIGGLRQHLGQLCGAASRTYTGQVINICIEREQFADAYATLSFALFDPDSPITRFNVMNTPTANLHGSSDIDVSIALCMHQDNGPEEIASYLKTLASTLAAANINPGKKPEDQSPLRDTSDGYFSFFHGDAVSAYRGFDFYSDLQMLMNPGTVSLYTSTHPGISTSWRYSSGD